MAHYKAIEGFEFHEKVISGGYEYYIFMNKHGQILIRRIQSSDDSTRFCLTIDDFATVVANPTIYNYTTLNHWKL